jgi:regulator of protease activity HflC (stomatin/prohibitin superfamily)
MYEWNLARLGLFAGDTVSYHVSADDNDTITGPKTAVSPTYTLRLPTLTEMFQQVSESQDAQTDMLGSLADAQDEVNDLVDSIMDRVRKNHELTLADEKELERALEMEEAIEQQRAEIAQEMAKALEEAMSRQAQAERERQARIILGTAETEIASKFVAAAETYSENPTALSLRAMNMLYESIVKRGSLMVVPSGLADSLNTTNFMGLMGAASADFSNPESLFEGTSDSAEKDEE